MSQYTADQIMEKVLLAIERPRNEDEELEEMLPPVGDEVRTCPGCGGKRVNALTRKGFNFYMQCKRCKTIYLDDAPPDLKSAEVYVPNKGYIAQYAQLVKQVCKHHVPDASKAWILTPYNVQDELAKYFGQKWTVSFDLEPEFRPEIAVLLFYMERMYFPDTTLKYLLARLDNNGIIMLYGASANSYKMRNNWPPMNTPVAGQNCTILSAAAVEKLARENGLKVLKYDIIGDNALAVLERG